jgi:hypothetical protein
LLREGQSLFAVDDCFGFRLENISRSENQLDMLKIAPLDDLHVQKA